MIKPQPMETDRVKHTQHNYDHPIAVEGVSTQPHRRSGLRSCVCLTSIHHIFFVLASRNKPRKCDGLILKIRRILRLVCSVHFELSKANKYVLELAGHLFTWKFLEKYHSTLFGKIEHCLSTFFYCHIKISSTICVFVRWKFICINKKDVIIVSKS